MSEEPEDPSPAKRPRPRPAPQGPVLETHVYETAEKR